jgi:hypothetical protein
MTQRKLAYVANIVTQQLFIQAVDEEEAETLYDLYFDGEDCPTHKEAFHLCGCVEFSDSNVFHDMEQI